MKTTILLFSLMLSLLRVEATPAQDRGTISGYIRDASTGETLLLANVIIEGTTIGATTNNAGFFSITGVPEGTHTVTASYLGYADARREVTLAPGERLRLDLSLTPDAVVSEEVTIQAEAGRQEARSIGISQVPIRMVQQMPAVFEADVFRSIQVMPGIKAASDFSSGLYIRGGGPDQTLIMLDRTTVYNPTHFFGFFSTFNPDAVKDVRIYKGGYPAEYGGRLGAVVDIYNKDGSRKAFQGKLRLGLLASSAMAEGPLPRGSWMIAGRRSTLEPYLALLRRQEDNVPDFYFYDLNAKVNFDASPDSRFSIAAYTGTDDVQFPISDDFDFDLGYGNRTVSATWTQLFSRRLFSSLTLTGSEYFNFPYLEFGGTSFERKNQVWDFSAKWDTEYMYGPAHEWKAGLWAGRLTLKLRDWFDGYQTLTSRIQTDYASAYVQHLWRPARRVHVQAGLRGNYFSEGDYLRLEPRVSGEYAVSGNLRLQAAYGRYYQFLTLITNEAFSGFDVWLTTGEGVPPAWGDQFVIGAKTSPRAGYNFDVELYYRTMNDLFELDPALADGVGLEYEEIFRFGEGFAYGAEFFLEKTRGRLHGFIAYTLATSRRRFDGYNNNEFYPPKHDRIHDVSAVMNYNLSRRWRATAVFSYATGQAYTEILGRGELQGPPTRANPRDFDIVGRINASRLPAYHRLDLSVSRIGRFFGLADSELQLQLINVYSRRNVWFYQYDRDENPPRQEFVRMLPIVPSLSYSITF